MKASAPRVSVVMVSKGVFWGMERKELAWEGFFSYFSYCVHFLFKKKLLCLEKLVTLVFSTWHVSIM